VSEPLAIVCWRWKPPIEDYRSTYAPETVNTLKRMIDRHYPDPHVVICCTDDPAGIDPDVKIVPIWDDFSTLPHPHSSRHPSCYRRLRAFSPEMREVFGPRFVSIDLDCVILDDLRPLWNRPEPFVGLAGMHKRTYYNGSMFLLTAGSRPNVWKDFRPAYSPRLARVAGHYGSDQAWISYALGPNEARWSKNDGVYSYRLNVQPRGGVLPADARVVFFNGREDPWGAEAQALPWIQEHYR
jgi:hypothetical protein